MENLSRILAVLICVHCREGRLEIAEDGHDVVCGACGSRFRIVNSVPCFVTDDRAGYSEVSPEKRAGFLHAKRIAYFEKSIVSSLYNHYHEYAAARRLETGRCPRTLDIGFGIGEHYQHITAGERQSGSFIGIDLDRFKLEYFTALHPGLPVLQADVFSLPLADNCMDVVQLLATLEHFTPDEIGMVLAEALRTLSPGGLLIACYPAEGGALLRVCQVLMHALIRLRSGFDLENEAMHCHRSTAKAIREILGARADLQRTDSRFFPVNIPCPELALFVNETYRKVGKC